ncbi:hypothetical protein RFI_39067, partial [Reticulomyxa filosa]
MDTGKTVILHNLESIYESLYDMLNQRYQTRPSGIFIHFFYCLMQIRNMYCRVALGTESRDCHIHENFKCVVVVQKEDAYSNMPVYFYFFFENIAFLSRFEKQFISYRNSLPSNINQHVEYAEIVLMEAFKVRNLSNLFCGYCEDTIFSALLYLAAQKAMQTDDIKDDEKKEQMQILNKNLNDIKFGKDELKSKLLDLFCSLCQPEEIVKMKIEEDIRSYSLGAIVEIQRKNCKDEMVMIITNDMARNIPIEWIYCTKEISSFKKVNQFEKTIKEFFNNEISEDILTLQCRYTSKSKYKLEQIIYILRLEHYLFYNNPINGEKHKLIILLIHTNKISPFPLIFRQKWKIFYVDSLLSTDTISLQKDFKNSAASVNLSKCACRAFGRLHFPHYINYLDEKRLLSLLFEDNKFRECGKILKNRVQNLLSKATQQRSVEDILGESGKKRMKGSFFERHQNIIDTLLTLTFVNVLFAVYQNGGFAKYVESKKRRGEKKNEKYQQLFERALQNEELVKMRPVNIDDNHLLLAVINPQLYSIRTCLQCSFPFSYSIHSWCQQQLSRYSKSPNNDLSLHATMLEQIPIGKDKLTNWEVDYSLKITHEYAMDLVRFEFWRLHTPNQQIILRNVIVSMALLLCGRLAIATIEVAIHRYRYIISHYAYLISVCSELDVEENIIKNQPGQWLAKMALSLWESILFRESSTMSEGLFFLNSISILFNFLLKHLQNSNTNLMNKLLVNARKIEIQRLGVMYCGTSEFVAEGKHLIEHGFLENETSVDYILQGYSTHQNASQQKYSDFIQDLLIPIKRVERIEKNADKRKVYISILPKLYSKIGNKLIPKMQLLKEMVSHGYLNNDLALYSDEATRLNRCLELMFLKKKINENSEPWKKLCDKSNTSDLGCVVKISKVKVDVTKLISTVTNEDIDLSQLEENQSVFNSLEEISKLLLDFSSCYKQYERTLYVWFLKQLYVWKGIHWIEIIFTQPDIGMNFPFLGRLKTNNIFLLLRARALHNNSFNPFIGVYGGNTYMDSIQRIMSDKSSVPLNSCSRNIYHQIIAQCFPLINSSEHHLNDQSQNFFLSAEVKNEYKQILQTITNWFSSKDSQTLSMRDTLDVIVTRLGFHFVSILPFMKQNPFQLLLVDSELFLPISTECETVSNEPLKVYYCSNNHALLIDGSEDILKQVKCQINGCGGTIIKTISKKSNQRKNTIDTKDDWFVLKRYYTSPKKAEPSTLKLLTSILIRLLYHLLLFLRNECIPQDTEKIRKLLKQRNKIEVFTFLRNKIKEEFIKLQIITNLNKELLCVALHLWIKDFYEKFEKWYPEGLPNNTLKVVYEFEEKLDKEYSTFFNCKNEFIELRNKSEIGPNYDNKELLELMSEIEEIKELDKCYKVEHLSQLFLEVRQ